jgi:hypothetical protein
MRICDTHHHNRGDHHDEPGPADHGRLLGCIPTCCRCPCQPGAGQTHFGRCPARTLQSGWQPPANLASRLARGRPGESSNLLSYAEFAGFDAVDGRAVKRSRRGRAQRLASWSVDFASRAGAPRRSRTAAGSVCAAGVVPWRCCLIHQMNQRSPRCERRSRICSTAWISGAPSECPVALRQATYPSGRTRTAPSWPIS